MRRVVFVGALAVVAALALWFMNGSLEPRSNGPTAPSGDEASATAPRERGVRERSVASAEAPPPSTVPEGACIIVTVVDVDDDPVAGATVRVARADRDGDYQMSSSGFYPSRTTLDTFAEITSGPDGRAGLADVTTGRWLLVADAPGHARTEAEVIWVEGDAPAETVLRMQPGGSLTVTVRDGNGVPRIGVEVFVAVPSSRFGPAGPARTWRAISGVSGTAQVVGLSPGVFEIRAWTEASGFTRSRYVRLPAVKRVDVVLPDGGTFRGRIVDATGSGVAEAQVILWSGAWMSFASRVATATTGSDGTYAARTYTEHASVKRLDVRASGFATRRMEIPHASVEEGRTATLEDVVLTPGARVEGVVTGPDGPVSGARIEVLVPGPGPFGERETESTTADAAGHYTLEGLPAGSVLLRAFAAGLVQEGADRYGEIGGFGNVRGELDELPQSAVVELAKGDRMMRDLRMERRADSTKIRPVFAGVVRHEDGTPVPHADVRVAGYANHCFIRDAGHTVSAADGSFRVVGEAAAGDFQVYGATYAFGSDESLRLEAHDEGPFEGLEIVLSRTPWVEGRVRSALGLPVAGARVRIGTHHYSKGGESCVWDETRPGTVAADGTFRIPVGSQQSGGSSWDSQGNDIVVCIEATGHAPAISTSFTWENAKDGVTLPEIELSAGAEIRGVVVDEDGTALSGIDVHLGASGSVGTSGWPPERPPIPPGVAWTTSDASGGFVIERLPAAVYAISASAPERLPVAEQVRAPATGVRLTLSAAFRIHGTALAPDGGPLRGAEVSLHQGERWAGRMTTGEAGEFAFDAVRAGEYEVRVQPPEDGPNALVLVVTARTREPALSLQTVAGETLSGTFLDGGGRPVADCHVDVMQEGDLATPWGLSTRTDEQGRFTVGRLVAGPVVLSISRDGESIGVEGVEAGGHVDIRLGGTSRIAGSVHQPDDQRRTWWGATLRLRPLDASVESSLVRTVRVDNDDTDFVFRDVAPGRHRIEVVDVSGEEGAAAPIKSVEVTAGDENVRIDFVR